MGRGLNLGGEITKNVEEKTLGFPGGKGVLWPPVVWGLQHVSLPQQLQTSVVRLDSAREVTELEKTSCFYRPSCTTAQYHQTDSSKCQN